MSAEGERRYDVPGAGLYLKLTQEAVRKRGRRARASRPRSRGASGIRTERKGKGECIAYLHPIFFPGGKEVEWLRSDTAAKRLERKRNTLTNQLNDHREKLPDGMTIARLPGLIGCLLGRDWRVHIFDATEAARV